MRGLMPAVCITAAILGIFAVVTACYYPVLPDRMASHFGADGFPNGWMPKRDFVWSFAGFLLFIEAITMGAGAFMDRFPTETINLPNKTYWLAPERRQASFAYVRAYTNWMGAATGALGIAVAHAVYRANIGDDLRLGNQIWVLLGIFVAFMVINTIGLFSRFQLPRR